MHAHRRRGDLFGQVQNLRGNPAANDPGELDDSRASTIGISITSGKTTAIAARASTSQASVEYVGWAELMTRVPSWCRVGD